MNWLETQLAASKPQPPESPERRALLEAALRRRMTAGAEPGAEPLSARAYLSLLAGVLTLLILVLMGGAPSPNARSLVDAESLDDILPRGERAWVATPSWSELRRNLTAPPVDAEAIRRIKAERRQSLDATLWPASERADNPPTH
ncbi:MAG: hypothetical protein NTX50_20855 [Candidatus Sumerlaeota bacterium]|nr:hypothetical protein [Candidatus Sumerlaeota bacterium]